MSQFKSVHWATEHWFNELADGMNAVAGDSNALCTVKRQLLKYLMHKHRVAQEMQCWRRSAVTWTGSQLVTPTTSKQTVPLMDNTSPGCC